MPKDGQMNRQTDRWKIWHQKITDYVIQLKNQHTCAIGKWITYKLELFCLDFCLPNQHNICSNVKQAQGRRCTQHYKVYHCLVFPIPATIYDNNSHQKIFFIFNNGKGHSMAKVIFEVFNVKVINRSRLYLKYSM